ncbi:alpha/beta fold hydrolase [Streptomyces sp. NPDC059862]|uniref:alpha/beta fold hydrolase n=1 Tax=unclassified Streptomyces TaxID=2593676 RepID=UPI00363EBD56
MARRAWCWEKLASVLHADGWRIRTIDLPSAGGRAGVLDDVQAVLGELELIDGPVVVVAHSCGGIPVSQAVAEAGNVCASSTSRRSSSMSVRASWASTVRPFHRSGVISRPCPMIRSR